MKRKEVGTEYAESGEVLEECGETARPLVPDHSGRK